MDNKDNKENKSKFSRLKTTKILKKEKPKANVEKKDNNNNNQQPAKTNNQQQGLSNKDKANFERLLKLKEKEIEGLKGKVTDYTSKESRSNLESECKSIFAEVGISEEAYKDVFETVCNNFTLTNGKLLNAKGQKGDVANFLREYTKERQYLLNQRKGSGLKAHSSSTKIKGSSGSGSFSEFRESRASEKNKNK